MPNYKLCRFCTSKYLPKSDERICPECEKDIVKVLSSPTGQADYNHGHPVILTKTPEDPMIEKIKATIPPEPKKEDRIQEDVVNLTEDPDPVILPPEVVEKVELVEAVKEEITLDDLEKELESTDEFDEPEIEPAKAIVKEVVPNIPVIEEMIEEMEEAIAELDKGEEAEIIVEPTGETKSE